MPDFRDLSSLFNYLQNQVDESLKTDVADDMVKVVQDHVQIDVYDAYEPSGDYIRTGASMQNVTHIVTNEGIEIIDPRNDNGKDVTKIIIEGKGYTWNGGLDERIGARPFMEEAQNDIEKSNLHTNSMKESLIRKGFKVV